MSGTVKNVWLVAEIASPFLSVRKLFPLPVWIAVLRRPTSDHVDSTKYRSGMVENVGVAVEIVSPSIFIQNVYNTFVLAVAILDFPLPVFAGSGTNGSRGMADPQSEPIGFEILLIPYLEA